MQVGVRVRLAKVGWWKHREREAYGRPVPRILGYTSYVAQLRYPKRAIVPRDEVFLLLLLLLLLLLAPCLANPLLLSSRSSHPLDASYFVACHPDNFGNFDGRLVPHRPRLIALQDRAIGTDFPPSVILRNFRISSALRFVRVIALWVYLCTLYIHIYTHVVGFRYRRLLPLSRIFCLYLFDRLGDFRSRKIVIICTFYGIQFYNSYRN